MKIFNPFFVTGTVGMILTAGMHIAFALLLKQASVHSAFYVLYPTFLAFLAIGFGKIRAARKSSLTTTQFS